MSFVESDIYDSVSVLGSEQFDRESMAESEADVEEGRVYSEEQIRVEFNVPKGDR